MPRDIDPFGFSELEREYEFDMDEPTRRGEGGLEEEYESFFEGEEPDAEYEFDDDREYEAPDGGVEEYAERFYELSQRQFESEVEAENALNELFTEMEPEYFFGSIRKALKKAKRVVGKVSRSPIGGLIKKGIAAAGGQIPAFQALKGITALARGDLRSLLTHLAKSGLGAALPGAGPFLPMAMKAMGFEAEVDAEENREAWNRFVEVSREAYEDLADNLNERADDPLEASRLANMSFQQALQNTSRARGQRRPGAAAGGGRRVVNVRPGEEIVIRVRRD